ncbi:MAG: amidase [Microscillaceae bacterium]|nr:amidase [Microscillaceae bacterium]
MSHQDFSILHLDGLGQAELIRKGEISPLELTELSIAAIEQLNPELNAVITPMYDIARKMTQGELPESPFRGVPMLLKDLMAMYKGVRNANGSKLFMHFIADHDSELTLRYKKAGLIFLGRTNLPEFGLLPTTEPEAFGATHNPWNPAHTPGGSSGGSAAAVASRVVAIAHANDGGGSIRIPAACCGLFGLKPTRGRNPVGPKLTELAGGLVAEHIVSRSVRDSAVMLDLTSGAAIGDAYYAPPKERSYAEEIQSAPKKLKIAYSTETPLGEALKADAQKCLEESLKLLEHLGHEIIEVKLPISLPPDKIIQIFSIIWATTTTMPLALFKQLSGMEPPQGMVEPLTQAFYEIAQKTSALDYELARIAVQGMSREIGYAFEDFDVWLSPVLAKPPLQLGELKQDPQNPLAPFLKASEFAPFTALFNITGQPAASVPIYWTEDGLPMGTQIVGKIGDEATLFRLAAQIEQERPWINKLPKIVI